MDTGLIIDDFLNDYDGMRKHCDKLSYDGMTSPVDNVFYPGVTDDIPSHVRDEIQLKLGSLFNGVKINYLFLRLSPEGTQAPHQAHNDESMGQYSFMLYLNRAKHCTGGTSFVEHVSGDNLSSWADDHSDPEKWNIVAMTDMKSNRACIFDASDMHRSEPIGGFGKTAKTARLVLVGFFDVD